ncbi:MAG TPA: histidine kinase, partial [Arenimonas sp.]|nr:histidine kinase [Arenimonas sp.]
FYVREQWQAQVQAQTQAAMDALQARIRPHFLFNSMNTIASLVRSDPATAERAVEDLSDLFRAALGADRGEATLAEEIELGRRYLDIEGLRLGGRLRVHWQLPEPLPMLRLPRLVLQPLLENAVLHGVARLPEGGRIDITLQVAGRTLEIVIRNPAAADSDPGLHNGHAQDSIAQRLRHRLGNGARLHAGREGADYVCRLHLPLP